MSFNAPSGPCNCCGIAPPTFVNWLFALCPNPHTVPSSNNAIVLFVGLTDTSATFSIVCNFVNCVLSPVVPSPKFP